MTAHAIALQNLLSTHARTIQPAAGAGMMIPDGLRILEMLREVNAPCTSAAHGNQTAATLFVNLDWDLGSLTAPLADLFGLYIDVGLVSLTDHVAVFVDTRKHPPLAAAFTSGNAAATRVLLSRGASVDECLSHSGAHDILELAGSWNAAGSLATRAVVAEHLMRIQLASSSQPAVAHLTGTKPHRRPV